jgi:dGTPase
MAVGMAAPRAVFACDPDSSRGRQVAEPPSRSRSAFRRDCDRVIHSTAFRRLKHKTQVFVFHEGDHYRTRLTHSLEVAQIARAVARQLGLDEDLTETLALAHDLGHPPFGHAGERALDECLKDFRGFDHNAQALRVVTLLERRYPDFDGLNLTWETLEGIVKHNGPLIAADGQPTARYRDSGVPQGIADFVETYDLELATFASLEAQVAALADDIAYNAHDIDDGLRADLFTLADLKRVPPLAEILDAIEQRYPALDEHRRAAALVRELISQLINDVADETTRRLRAAAPRSADDVRRRGAPTAAFSSGAAACDQEIKDFLWDHMYRHERVMNIMREAEDVVRDLFTFYRQNPDEMPSDWSAGARTDEAGVARRVGDFIAGMTDRFALTEHVRIFKSTPELR